LNEYRIDLSDLKDFVSPQLKYGRVIVSHMFNFAFLAKAEPVLAFFVSPFDNYIDFWASSLWMSESILNDIIQDYYSIKYEWYAPRYALRDRLTFEKIEEIARKYGLDIYYIYDGLEFSIVLVVKPRGESK
jgi:hypothetical protein